MEDNAIASEPKGRSTFDISIFNKSGTQSVKVSDLRRTLESAIREAIQFYLEHYKQKKLNGEQVVVHKVVMKGRRVLVPPNAVNELVKKITTSDKEALGA